MVLEDYWISEDKRGGKLHITGGCPHFPGQNVKAFTWVASPELAKWTSFCKKCWKGVPPEGGADSANQSTTQESESTSSGSSSSSASEAEEGI